MYSLLKKTVLAPLVIGMALLTSTQASAFSNLYIFGDSLSDTGNLNLVTQGQIPARFTNGDVVAVDILAASLGTVAAPSGYLAQLNLGNNYAVGGAVAITEEGDFTNLPQQIGAYLQSTGGIADPEALYVVVIGGNDLFTAQGIRAQYVNTAPGEERQAIRKASRARVDEAVTSVENLLLALIGAGAQHILVGNAPDISKVPNTDLLVANLLANAQTNAEAQRAEKMYALSAKLVDRYNRKLSRAIGGIEALTGLDIIEWDLESFLDGQIEDAEALGYTNTEDACAPVPQGLPCDGFIFADGVHPTSEVHTRAGQNIVELLNAGE